MFTRTTVSMALVVATIWLLFAPNRCWGQDEKAWKFPSELKSELESRIRRFTTAQATGHWDEVAAMLGDYRRGASRYLQYTAAHKACLISQMQISPMIDFTFTVQESPFSSEILSTPPSRRWWTLVGEGVFREPSGPVKRTTWVTAYRDRGTWFFTPPPFDNAAARSKVTADELLADLRDRVHLTLPRDCPLDVVDLHVHRDANEPSARRIEFRFHNRTRKRVTAYSFEISDERHDGSSSTGTGALRDALEPQGISRKWEETHTAYTYWCEGEVPILIDISSVTFEDGTTWKRTSAGGRHSNSR